MTATSILRPIKPCVKCGAVDRYASGVCKRCAAARYAANSGKAKAYSAAYRAANPAKTKAAQMTWRAAHKDRQKATTAAWQAANKDKMKAYQAARYAENPEKIKASAANWAKVNRKSRRITEQNREARKRENGGVLSKGLATKLFKLQKAKCPCCNQLLGKDYHLDHNMPIALGVMNIDSNMQLLRKRCNLQKSAKNPVEFMQSKGFLL